MGYDVENYVEFHIILTMAARPRQAWILSQAQDHQARPVCRVVKPYIPLA